MKWKVAALPRAQVDLLEAADWYDFTSMGLGVEFIKAVLAVLDALALNPLLHCKRHPTRNIRWRNAKRFPYRVVYEVIEDKRLVVVVGIIHNARQDTVWQERFRSN